MNFTLHLYFYFFGLSLKFAVVVRKKRKWKMNVEGFAKHCLGKTLYIFRLRCHLYCRREHFLYTIGLKRSIFKKALMYYTDVQKINKLR